jgi:hypothetical protein
MSASLTHEAFTQQVNTKFQIQGDQNTRVELELTEVSDVKLYPQQEEFAIVFRGPREILLHQGIHSFTHEQMGQFEMFIVPVRQDEHGFYYEAVFNRLRE